MRTLVLSRGPQVRQAVLLALVAGVPVVFLRVVNDPIGLPKLAFLGVGVVLVAAVRGAELLQGASPVGLKRLLVPAVAVAGPLTLAWIASPYRDWALLGVYGRLQGLLPYLLTVALGVLVADAFAGRAARVAWALLGGAAVVGGYALVQVIGADPFDWFLAGAPTTAVSTTGNPNFTGGMLAMALPVAIGLWLAEPARRRWIVRLGVPIVGGWVAAWSQGGWAAGVAGLAVVAGFAVAHRHRLAPVAGLGIAAAIAAAVVIVPLFGALRPGVAPIPGTFVQRGYWWQAAARMGAASPLLGRGPNVFAIEGARHRTTGDALEQPLISTNDPHSVPLSFFANAGVPGVLGLVVVLVWALRKVKERAPPDLLATAFFAAVVGYFIQSLVSLDNLPLRAPLWAALGGLAVAAMPPPKRARGKKARSAAKPRRRTTRAAAAPLRYPLGVAVLAVVVLGALVAATALLVADGRVREGRLLFAEGRLPEAQREFERALALRDDAEYHHIFGVNLGAAALEEGRAARKLFERATQELSYVEEVPRLPGLLELARLLHRWAEETGDRAADEDSLAAYRKAVDIDDRNPLLRVQAAGIAFALERPDAARDLLEPLATIVGDRFPQFWGALALARAETGETGDARDALQAALSLDPDEPRALEAQETLDGGG